MTAGDIMASAAVLLNDSAQFEWTDTALLPYLQKAWTEFKLRIKEQGVVDLKEISTTVSVPTSKTTISTSDIADLSYPISLEERESGSSELWTPMEERNWEPNIDKDTCLLYWTWREQEVKLLGATVAREVRLKYIKSLGTLSSDLSVITIEDAELFLAARTAAIASALGNGNFERAQILDADAEIHFQTYLNIQTRAKQAFPIRHSRYRK